MELDKFEGTDYIMIIALSKPNSKVPKSHSFGSKFKDFDFSTKLCIKTNSRALISIITILFSNFSPKIPITSVFVPNLRVLIFTPNFALGQIYVC